MVGGTTHNVDTRITLLTHTKDLTVGGISPPSLRQDGHMIEAVGTAVVFLLSQGNAKGLSWDIDALILTI